jgi:lambda family phage portal protein
MPEFKTIDRYKTAELQAAVVNAMVAGVIESGLPAEQILEFFGGKVESYLSGRAEHKVKMQGGTIIPLYPGDKWSSHTPSRPNAQFGDFMENIHRHIGASIGLPLELLMKDFSQTNYSSARAALLEAWRFFGCRRDALITYWCDPIYQMWLEELIGAKGLEGVTLEQYLDDPIAWSRCGWIGDGRGWIDPLKEAQASEYRRKAGVSTLAREAAEQGLDWRDVQEDIVSEEVYIRDLREKAGLDPVPMDPLTKAKTEALTASGQKDEAEAEETKEKPVGRARAEEKEE